MELLTQELREQLPPLYSQEHEKTRWSFVNFTIHFQT